ncbi:hypothetical protein MMC28_002724 [Mycoblastus sanguinarius]|nr:hypothetical protein [Mycoblastus sanguinarius]
MAEELLRQLPKIEHDAHENSCIVCHEPYGTKDSGDGEYAVRLPCPGHHVIGNKCIATWLLTTGKRSCPHCRHELFPAQEDEIRQNSAGGGQTALDTSPPVGWVALSARTASERNLTLRVDATYLTARVREGQQRSAARRSRHERETEMYNHLQRLGAPFPDLTNDETWAILTHSPQGDALFQWLEGNGAFDEVPVSLRPAFRRARVLSNRDVWHLLREEGYAFCPATLANRERAAGWGQF